MAINGRMDEQIMIVTKYNTAVHDAIKRNRVVIHTQKDGYKKNMLSERDLKERVVHLCFMHYINAL